MQETKKWPFYEKESEKIASPLWGDGSVGLDSISDRREVQSQISR